MAGSMTRLTKQTSQLMSPLSTRIAASTRLFCNSSPNKPPQQHQEKINKPKIEDSNDQQKQDVQHHGETVNKMAEEFDGPKGPEPTRYGDWERNGRCYDF